MSTGAAATKGRSELAGVFADERAFRAWYEAALPQVYGYLYHRCGRDPDLVQELTQQAFVEAIRSHPRFKGRSDPTTWLIGIARHRLLDHFRRAERERRRLVVIRSGDQEPSRRELVVEAPGDPPDEIDDALAALPALQRAVLVLHYMDRLSVRDIARSIGKSEAATASLLARARDAFRRRFEETDR